MNLAVVWNLPGVKYPQAPAVDPLDEDKNARSRASMARKRARYRAQGLTAEGKPFKKRQKSYNPHCPQCQQRAENDRERMRRYYRRMKGEKNNQSE
jgi:hypothetical protein